MADKTKDPEVEEDRRLFRNRVLIYSFTILVFVGLVIGGNEWKKNRDKKKREKDQKEEEEKPGENPGDSNMPPDTSTTPTDTEQQTGLDGWAYALIGGAAVVVIGGAAYVFKRRKDLPHSNLKESLVPFRPRKQKQASSSKIVGNEALQIGSAYPDGLCLFHSLFEVKNNRKGKKREVYKFANDFVKFARKDASSVPQGLIQDVEREVDNVENWVKYNQGTGGPPRSQPDLGTLSGKLVKFLGKNIRVYNSSSGRSTDLADAKQGTLKVEYSGDGNQGHYQPVLDSSPRLAIEA